MPNPWISICGPGAEYATYALVVPMGLEETKAKKVNVKDLTLITLELLHCTTFVSLLALVVTFAELFPRIDLMV